MPTLYAWARPLSFTNLLDHTWVTDYEPASQYSDITKVEDAGKNCWYCWGTFHDDDYRPIGSIEGNLDQSSCIAVPNVAKGRASHGTIYRYGINGVCHQLANQVLFSSTGKDRRPLTVSDARGYKISSFLYKTYGRPNSRWKILAHRCVGVPSVLAGVDDFIDHLLSFGAGFIEDLEFDGLLALREDFAVALHGITQDTALMSDPNALAERINAEINKVMSQAHELLGMERYQMIFEFDPREPAHLVDPEVLVDYFDRLDGEF